MVMLVHRKLLQTDKQAGPILFFFLAKQQFLHAPPTSEMSIKKKTSKKKEKRRKYCTLNVERVVNDKVSIPHHGEINW